MADRGRNASTSGSSHKSRGKEKEVLQSNVENGNRFTGRSTNISQSGNTSKGEMREDLQDVEICGICLSELGKETGKLDSCSHRYCLGCIKQWANIETRCPMCKQRFNTITMSSNSSSAVPSNSSHENSKIIFGYPRKDQTSASSGFSYRLVTANSELPLVRSDRNKFRVAFENGESVEAGIQEGFMRLRLMLDPEG